jgi:RHS repeat-associated protein
LPVLIYPKLWNLHTELESVSIRHSSLYGNTFVQGHIFAAGRHLASVGGWTTFNHSDWLGTEALPHLLERHPLPDRILHQPALRRRPQLHRQRRQQPPLHRQERDAATGLDNFGARYNSSPFGRFMSADWSDDPDPVPYADLSDPKTLNLYAYTGNNPVNATDDDGHQQADAPVPAGICGGSLCKLRGWL